MKVIGLGRASTFDQELTRMLQETKIKQYCELYNLELVGFAYHHGISGAKRDREGREARQTEGDTRRNNP